jgi:hypothetical protein
MDRGKRRSASQRIGKEGEMLFEIWATKRGLTTNKVQEDMGIDFFCQVLKPLSAKRSEESTGRVLGVQVKTVESGSSPKITLNRVDAAELLNQTQATCIVAIRLLDESIRFQFITVQEVDVLLAFLASRAKTFSIAFDKMDSDDDFFQKLVAQCTTPGAQQRLRIHVVQERITRSVPNARVSVNQTSTVGFSEVSVPWLGSAFDIHPSSQETARVRVFERGESPIGLPGVTVKPEIFSVLELADGPGMLVGKNRGLLKATVEYQGDSASATFVVRVLGTEAAYVHRAGIRIAFSKRRNDPVEGWVHDLELNVFAPLKPVPLRGKILAFLQLLRPGAKLLFGKDRRPIEKFNAWLAKIGPAVTAAQKIFEALCIDFDEFQLVNLKDEEFVRTLTFMDAFLLQSIPLELLFGGLVVGSMAELPPEKIRTKPAALIVPIVMNLKDKGIVLWVSCKIAALFDADKLCGFHIERQLGLRIDINSKRFVKSNYPEIWIHKKWPVIRLGADQPGSFEWSPKEQHSEISLEATITELEDVAI